MNYSPDITNIHSFLKGIDKFYKHFSKRKAANQVIWQEGSTQILNFSENYDSSKPTIIFIPSLINKSYICH